MGRFRLRFQLHEVDLPGDVTAIGRDASCEVTIDDPLVSRRHALIRVDGEAPSIEDLDSRNGTRVNDVPLTGVTPLADGDRIRIGRLEVVFCGSEEKGPKRWSKTTGSIRLCGQCSTPHAVGVSVCPTCGSVLEESPASTDTLERQTPRG